MKLSTCLLAVSVGLFAGCATSSPIQRYSESDSHFSTPPKLISNKYPASDIYCVYHRAATGFVSIQSIREAAEARARDFADQRGKGMVVLGERISEPPYILGNFPRIELVFALTDKPATGSAAVQPTAAPDKYSELERLKKLLDDGTLTKEEFDREKAKILNGKS